MGHRSHHNSRLEEQTASRRYRRIEQLRLDWGMLVLSPLAQCAKQDVHMLCVACAEAEFLDGYDRDVVLDGWDAMKLPKLGVGIAHVMGCGCTIVAVQAARLR